MTWDIRCDTCGRSMVPGPGSSWVFVPDSCLSYEENRLQCAPCTEKHGRLTPSQNVVESMCCGVVTTPTVTASEVTK